MGRSLRERELQVGPVLNSHPALSWKDSNLSERVVSHNRVQGPSTPLRKSENSNGGVPCNVIAGIVVLVFLTTQTAALITRKVRGSGNSPPRPLYL